MRLLFRDHRRHESEGRAGAIGRLRQFKGEWRNAPHFLHAARFPLTSRLRLRNCVRELLIELAIPNIGDQGVND
jgi:hypothetical protein